MQLTHTDIVECKNKLKSLFTEQDICKRYDATKAYIDTLPESVKKWAQGVDARGRISTGDHSIPDRHRDFDLAAVTHPQWIAKFNRLVSMLDTGAIVGLAGKRGSGKTQMAIEAVKLFKLAGWPASYDRLTDFYIQIKSTFRRESEETEAEVIDRWTEPRLLVLDECHEKADTSWVSTMLNHLIDKRYGNRTDTIMIANLQTGKGNLSFADAVGSSIGDRMCEGGGLIDCNWDSFRGAK